MEAFKKGWFNEINEEWKGQSFGLKVKEVLYEGKTEFQDILVFESEDHGRVLVLNGIIQCTEKDEFSYQEMITHLPMMSHPNPRKVLVIGGGDGGVLREVVKHPMVESVTLCEIDETVINLAKKYLPHMACGFNHPKVKVHIGDGFKFMAEHKDEFDVIITDGSDPEGPAEELFKQPFYELVRDALKEGGICSTQGECSWLDSDNMRIGECPWIDNGLVVQMTKFMNTLFPSSDYGCFSVPTYTTGLMGIFVCSKNPETDFRNPVRTFTNEEVKDLGLRFYNSEYHKACFVLPQFIKEMIEECETRSDPDQPTSRDTLL